MGVEWATSKQNLGVKWTTSCSRASVAGGRDLVPEKIAEEYLGVRKRKQHYLYHE